MSDVVNRRLMRSLRQTLYTLKRSFGGTVYAYTLLDAETDYTTGIKTSTQEVTRIPRAIVLPIKVQREQVQTLSIISANKAFAYGGMYDAGTRLFVIDARDVASDFEFKLDDWLVYDNQRFSPKSIEKLELNSGWLVIGRAVEEANPPLAQQEILHNLSLTDTVTEVLI